MSTRENVSVSVITPTIGRQSLKTMLKSLLPQLSSGDEVLVIGDGPQPAANAICAKFPMVRYWEAAVSKNYGNPQRNEAMKTALGKRLFFVDDDDVVLPGALDAIRMQARKHPAAPLMFRMKHPSVVIWSEKKVCPGNVSGQMFVIPNVRDRLGVWSGRYEADQDFISSTLALYPDGEKSVVWCPETLVVQGLAGKGAAGGVER